MITNNLLREYEGAALEESVLTPLISALTVMNKFTVLPLYYVHFLISKISYVPKIIITSIDDRDTLISASNADTHMNDLIYDKTPKTVSPTAVVFPSDMYYGDLVYNVSEDYFYSSTYIVAGKELKDMLSKKVVEIVGLKIYSDNLRKNVRVSIGWKFNTSEGYKEAPGLILYPLPETIKELKLPLINYTSIKPQLNEIINAIASKTPDVIYQSANKEDLVKINEMVNETKEKQMYNIEGTDIKVFRDFVKQKPTNVKIWSCDNIDSENNVDVKDVALNMSFNNSKQDVILIYRYLNNIIDSLNPNEEE